MEPNGPDRAYICPARLVLTCCADWRRDRGPPRARRSVRRIQLDPLRFTNQAAPRATRPSTTLTEPRTPWLPLLTLPEWPTESRKPMLTPAKKSTARMINTTPITASAMTSGRFEPAPPDTVSELTFFLLWRRDSPRAVSWLRECGSPRGPGGPPACRGVCYVPKGTTSRAVERATSGKRR